MPNLKLDLRRPVIVITGIFNPAIFSPGWVAHHLFGMAVGETVNMAVADGVGASGIAAFLNSVGISVSQSRMEFFAADAAEETFEAVEKAALRIIELLPHSPLGALGLNANFEDEDPDEAVIALFSTREKLEEHFEISQREQTVKIAVEDGHRKIKRDLADSGFSLSFNRHYDDINPANAEQLLVGAVRREVGWCKDFCKEFFGCDEIGSTTFEMPET